jgi:hypothetical protein
MNRGRLRAAESASFRLEGGTNTAAAVPLRIPRLRRFGPWRGGRLTCLPNTERGLVATRDITEGRSGKGLNRQGRALPVVEMKPSGHRSPPSFGR